MNKYIIWSIIFAVGMIVGAVSYYIWKRKHTIGVLKIYDDMQEGQSYIFMELNEEFKEFRANSIVSLRVENASYYENQNS